MAVLKYKDPATGAWIALGTGAAGDVFGYVDENNTIVLQAALPAGVYTLKYENADGTATEIGTITVGSGGADSGYVNLADPTSADWLTNKRINSSKDIVDVDSAVSGGNTCVVTNFMDIAGVSKLHVKGLDVINNVNGSTNYGRMYTYINGTIDTVTYQPSAGLNDTLYYTVADYDSSVVILDVAALLSDWNRTGVTHVRLGGILTGAAEDVIITADENIV